MKNNLDIGDNHKKDRHRQLIGIHQAEIALFETQFLSFQHIYPTIGTKDDFRKSLSIPAHDEPSHCNRDALVSWADAIHAAQKRNRDVIITHDIWLRYFI